MEVLSEYAGERFGHWDRLGPKGNTHLLWREDDGGRLQRGDADQRLSVQKQQRARNTVWTRLRLPGEELLEPRKAPLLGSPSSIPSRALTPVRGVAPHSVSPL